MPESALQSWGAFDQNLRDDPYPLYARLREQAPVHRATLPDGRAVWLVTRLDEARAALADPRLTNDPRRFGVTWVNSGGRQSPSFLDSPLAYHMLNADPPDHTRLRKLVSKAFTARRVEELRPRVNEITEDLLAVMAARDEDVVDLMSAFAYPLPIRVICELLGVPPTDRAAFREWFTTMLASTYVHREQAHRAAGELAGYIVRLLAAKRDHPADDMLSALVAARDGDQRLDEHELTSMVFLLLVAGHETTVNLIGNGMAALFRDRDQLADLRDDPSLVPAAVEELLRYDGPVEHATSRFTSEPVDIGGVTVPDQECVLVVLGAADHDPRHFTEPDRLDVGRAENQHLAFGHGAHYCLGAPLARMEGQIAFSSLLAHFPAMRLAPAAELHWRPGMFVRGLDRLPVTLQPATD